MVLLWVQEKSSGDLRGSLNRSRSSVLRLSNQVAMNPQVGRRSLEKLMEGAPGFVDDLFIFFFDLAV